MALIKCPECGKMFSEYAEHCPECGCPTEDAKAANKENDSPTSQNIEETESDKYISSNVADNFEAKTLSQESIKPSTEDDRDTVEEKDSIRKLLLYIGIIIVIMIGSIIANHVYTKKNEEHAKAEQEQLILERAQYIFDNLPDHKAIEDVDKTVFTPSFLTVLEKANELDAADPQDLSFEDAFYWYTGNECPDDRELLGIDVTKIENDTAYVKVIYKNYEEEEHTMRMVRMDEQWYCDEWDNKKETLSNLCERVESNYIDD